MESNSIRIVSFESVYIPQILVFNFKNNCFLPFVRYLGKAKESV